MNRNIVRTVCLATLLLSLAAVASAQGGQKCTNRLVAGDWGYTKTGTLFLPTGPVPFATMGKLTLEADGTLSGVNTGSVGGSISLDELWGTFAIDADCTGEATVQVYDQAGTLLRTIEMALVVDDDLGEFRGIVTKLQLPNNGPILRTVITLEARRMFPNHGDRR